MGFERTDSKQSAAGLRFGIVVSHFNDTITDGLLRGALKALSDAGSGASDSVVVHVPGAFEIPIALGWLAERGDLDALIALGAVVQGETSHYEHISNAAIRGVADISLKWNIPIGLGVITVLTVEQAIARSSDNESNKGREAALAAIEMANLRRSLSQTK